MTISFDPLDDGAASDSAIAATAAFSWWETLMGL